MAQAGLKERNIVHIGKSLVNTNQALSVAEIDLILVLIAQIDKDDAEFKALTFTVAELEKRLGRKLHSKQLLQLIRSVGRNPIVFVNADYSNWEVYSWFEYFKYKNGIIECKFCNPIKPFLLQIQEKYVMADIRALLQMSSSYSKRIYMLLKEYHFKGGRTFGIEELKEILKIEDKYKLYGHFKKRVLEQAINDINKYSDIEISLQETKRLKSVVEVTFTIKKNDNDLKQFISNIRECYPNQRLYDYKGDTILCSEKGLLYSEQTLKTFDKKTAQIIWELLHEKREYLYPFQTSLFELQNNLDKISNQI